MTFLLYAYKATEDDGMELRYSLRSVERNLHVGDLDVMVVGDKPSWFVEGHHVEGNPTQDKPTNMLWNVREACDRLWEWGVDKAIYLSDDYLLMYPQEDVLPVAHGPLDKFVSSTYIKTKPKDDWYRVAIEQTQRYLHRAGCLEPLSFEMHHPLPLDTARAGAVLSSFIGVMPAPFWRTIYGNLVGFERPVRVAQDGLYFGQSPMKIGTPWVSAIPTAWEAHMERRARRMFREPSRWESTL